MFRLITEPDFYAVAKAAKEADKAIIRELRAGLRRAGEDTAREVRDAIGQIPSSGRYGTGVRAALKAGTRVSIRTSSPRTAGVLIVTDPRRLPPGKRPLAKALNSRTFKHPVMADPARTRKEWAWVDQAGRPYFGAVIAARQQQMTTDIWRAMKRAEAQIMKESAE